MDPGASPLDFSMNPIRLGPYPTGLFPSGVDKDELVRLPFKLLACGHMRAGVSTHASACIAIQDLGSGGRVQGMACIHMRARMCF